jgi:hypothetical protein
MPQPLQLPVESVVLSNRFGHGPLRSRECTRPLTAFIRRGIGFMPPRFTMDNARTRLECAGRQLSGARKR